ncbi:glycosyltransferase [Novosphingobium sp. ZN18A2]|uniref:glycosyltransferase n=1 Tax=Novosphingobium sp. ZN18A2 TaxID=3079861 RepID=UPI0030D404CE
MRIVDVCAFHTPHGGGVKTYIDQKLRLGPELGHEIVILAPADRDEVIEHGPRARVVTIKAPRFLLDRKYWYFDDQPALHRALDALEPDFVEVSSPWRSAAMVERWNGGVPRALVMHADPLSAYAYRYLEPLMKREDIDKRFDGFWEHLRQLGSAFDRVVCASRELRDRLAEGGVPNTVLHPMGVEAGVFSPENRNPELRRALLERCELPESAHLLIGVGRLSAEKRWPMIVDAVTAASQHQPIGLVILGAGKQRDKILRHIGGNPHIRVLAPERDRKRFAAILASTDALVHGCEAETFCMAAAEARASGVPVIVPDRGGAADHARDGAGVNYRSASALSAARAITTLLGQPRNNVPVLQATMRDHFTALFEDYRSVTGKLLDVA